MGAMKIDIKNRSGARVLPDGVLLNDNATVGDLARTFAELKPKFYPSRQRWTLPPKEGQRSGQVLDSGKKLEEYGIADGSALVFKDLGPQIGYATVFFWEYLGPLLIYPLFYFLPKLLYPGAETVPAKVPAQTLALAYWSFHYAKRILETFYVHQFSHGTMPLPNLFRNCAYYWSFAAYVSYFVNHPLYTPPSLAQTYAALALSVVAQAANFRCHVILANLRPSGGGGYVVPRGFLFNYITCPNYTAEVVGWVGFTFATQALPAAIFTLVGGLQMAQWAAAKHARLRKMFDGREGRERYPRRYVMLPFLF